MIFTYMLYSTTISNTAALYFWEFGFLIRNLFFGVKYVNALPTIYPNPLGCPIVNEKAPCLMKPITGRMQEYLIVFGSGSQRLLILFLYVVNISTSVGDAG